MSRKDLERLGGLGKSGGEEKKGGILDGKVLRMIKEMKRDMEMMDREMRKLEEVVRGVEMQVEGLLVELELQMVSTYPANSVVFLLFSSLLLSFLRKEVKKNVKKQGWCANTGEIV